MSTNHGATPRSAGPLPPRPCRGHGSLTGWSCHAGRPPFAPRQSAASTRTTTVRVMSHVISAAGVVRWKALTQPHHAHAARTATPMTMWWPRTVPVYPTGGPSGACRAPR